MVDKIFPYTRFVLVVVRANCAPVCPVGGMERQKSRTSYFLENWNSRRTIVFESGVLLPIKINRGKFLVEKRKKIK